MADRYCKDCGQELWSEDRFCAGCARPLHATAQVPTPEADVPVPPPQEAPAPAPTPEADVPIPPPPHPAGGSSQTAGSEASLAEAPPAEEAPPAPPSPSQAQQRPVGRWRMIRQPILLFLGSLVVAGLQAAFWDAPPGEFAGKTLEQMFARLILFAPLWLFSGGFLYLIVRLLGRKPSFLQVVFGWRLSILIVILVLLSGVFTYL